MAKNKKTLPVNIPLCLAAILFCLALFSIRLTTGLYSKFTSAASGSDSARVIKFGELTLTETGDFYEENKLMIIPGVDLQKKAVVDFAGSEAATYIFIEVALTGWETEDNYSFAVNSDTEALMQWSLADGWTHLKTTDGTYIYYRELAPNTAVEAADIIADDGKITVSKNITKSIIETMTGISIKLRATVVQSGGFDSPEAAWNSIAAKEGSANE